MGIFDFNIDEIDLDNIKLLSDAEKQAVLVKANSKKNPLEGVEFSTPLELLAIKGITGGLSNEAYHAEQLHMSSSKLKLAQKSEYHFVYSEKFKKSNSSFDLGNVVHSDIENRINGGTWQNWKAGTFKTLTTVKQDSLEVHESRMPFINTYRQQLERNEITKKVLNNSLAEVSCFAVYEGVKVKIRLDAVTYDKANDALHIFDWKTSNDIAKFNWQIRDYGYDISAGMYSKVLEQITRLKVYFHFVIIETGNNLTGLVQVVPISDDTLKEYQNKFQTAFDQTKGIDFNNPKSYDTVVI